MGFVDDDCLAQHDTLIRTIPPGSGSHSLPLLTEFPILRGLFPSPH